MNEYRRRQETFWTVLSTAVFFVTTAVSAHFLFRTRGPMLPDPAARADADRATEYADACQRCLTLAGKLVEEMRVVRDLGPTMSDPEPASSAPVRGRPGRPPPPPPRPTTDDATAWSTVSSAHKLAQKLATCDAIEPGVEPPVSLAVVKRIASVPAPTDSSKDRSAARSVYDEILRAMDDPKFAGLVGDLEQSCSARKALVAEAEDRASKAQVEGPLPTGLLGRSFAIYTGVGLSIAAFVVALISLQLSIRRRGLTAITARRLGASGQHGAQAATLLRLAATSNGGEPGIVIGAGIGGLLFVAVNRTDADWFVVGTMAGLLVGLVIQMIIRSYWISSRFRERALELSEVEKPAIPIVLALEGIERERERDFLTYFLRLDDVAAAKMVEGLAAQAENRILEAADARTAPVGR